MTQEKPNYSIEQIICLLEVRILEFTEMEFTVILNEQEDYSESSLQFSWRNFHGQKILSQKSQKILPFVFWKRFL